MKVEVTFFLVNGKTIGHVDDSEESVEVVLNKYGSRLGTKATIELNADMVISTQHITHFIAKEHDGGVLEEPEEDDEANLPDVLKINGRSIRAVYDMETPEFIQFIGDDLPKTQAEVSELALKWGMANAHLVTLLYRHGLIDDL